MTVPKAYRADVKTILSHRLANGADFWSSLEGGIGVGSPFSTLEAVLMLTELGVEPDAPALRGAAKRILACWRDDGRIHVQPQGAVYPCHTANALRVLCRLGYGLDARIAKSCEHLLETQEDDGGWRCNTYKYGRGPETVASNPGPTLNALDAFRYVPPAQRSRRLDRAVAFLLGHWDTRAPLGPCHFGIGSRFLKIEYPFFRYNLFAYVYILSFYESARTDRRFLAALRLLESKLVNGQVVVEYARQELRSLRLCEPGRPSPLATRRYREILANTGGEADAGPR